ncbi:MAG: hypothetical protein ACE5Z5_09275 [Candidatus Bathyarchaeia archaeon]
MKRKWENFSYTAYGSKILYVIIEDDVQEMAKKRIGRTLTDDELTESRKVSNRVLKIIG